MVFSSLEFLFIFLPLVLFFYFIVPSRYKNIILVIFSLIFYAWGEPIYILIMLFSTIFDFTNGLLIEKYRHEQHITKIILLISLIGNLGILGFYKYSDFLIQIFNNLLKINISYFHLALPIGISFYTFQTLSYTIDVYRNKVSVQKNIIDFATYVTLFPQLVAGPIVQYKDIEQQLHTRTITLNNFVNGIERFVFGLFKKVVLANNVGMIWQSVSSSPIETMSVIYVWLGALAFTFQIYFDFSGYSDMAIGMGKMFGFHFHENFQFPYCAKSVSEFWRRWHISLGQWFKDYVYIPLGGSRCSKTILIRNICIVWFLTGLWHGASWNFVLWGMYFAIFLIIEKCFIKQYLSLLPSFLRIVMTFIIVVISWVIFAFDDIQIAILYLQSMLGIHHNPLFSSNVFYLLSHNCILLIICFIFAFGEPIKTYIHKISQNKLVLCFKPVVLTFILFISICFLVGESYNPFLYFRF